MEVAGGSGPARWGTAIALTVAVVFLSALDRVPLVALPAALMMLLVPVSSRRWTWVALGALAWAVGMGASVGPLGALSRTWALLLGGSFLAATLWRPGWGVSSRALLALALSLFLGGAWLGVTGEWLALDTSLRQRLLATTTVMIDQLRENGSDPKMVEQFGVMLRQAAEVRWRLFPAMLGLQSLASLALAAWIVGRLRRAEPGPFRLHPLRDFRFNDQLVWVVIVGLILVVLPVGAWALRVGYNALLFMGGLYALRGFGVLLFLVGGMSPAAALFYGSLVAIAMVVPPLQILFLVVLTAATLVGLGDTWLDVRGRSAVAPPT